VTELGEKPVPFTEYCGDLYAWAKRTKFTYPYRTLTPSAPESRGAAWA
jgi:hypothetical protein